MPSGLGHAYNNHQQRRLVVPDSCQFRGSEVHRGRVQGCEIVIVDGGRLMLKAQGLVRWVSGKSQIQASVARHDAKHANVS
jgi:hypothetical protein